MVCFPVLSDICLSLRIAHLFTCAFVLHVLSAVFGFEVSFRRPLFHDVVVCCVSCNLRLQPTIVDVDVHMRGSTAPFFGSFFPFSCGRRQQGVRFAFPFWGVVLRRGVLRSVSMRGGGGWSRRLESLVCASLPLDCSFVCDDV